MHAQNPLGYERLGKLLARFAVPSVISMLVSALYNMSIRFLSDKASGI